MLHTIRLILSEHSEQLHVILSEIGTRNFEETDSDFVEQPFRNLDEFLSFDNELGTSVDKKEKLNACAIQRLGTQ